MDLLPFKKSADFSIGMELEFQLINPSTFNLMSQAKKLIESVEETKFETIVKPEITQSMLEINSSIHSTPKTILEELIKVRKFLLEQAKKLNVLFCGGGTHPFQKWVSKKIFPSPRFKELSRKYQYLSKRATVFGLHIHIGCSSAEKALYLTHVLGRYVPQFIAMSAASPFYEKVDTGFHSSRVTIFNAFPLSGIIPYLTHWKDFSNYFYHLKNLGIVESMKDFYWDIRPKPEFGTVEIRVCDTPLTFTKAVMFAAYIQSLSCYLLREEPLNVIQEIYTLYYYNRFQAARYGLEGVCIDPYTQKRMTIKEDILATIEKISSSAAFLGNTDFIEQFKNEIMQTKTDADLLREIYHEKRTLQEVVHEQCKMWEL